MLPVRLGQLAEQFLRLFGVPVPVTDVCGNRVCLEFFIIEDDPVAAVNQDEPTAGLILEVDDPDLFDQAVLPDVFAKLLQPRLGHVGNNSQAG